MGKTSGLAATKTVFVFTEHQNTASSFSKMFGNWSAATQRWLCLARGLIWMCWKMVVGTAEASWIINTIAH